MMLHSSKLIALALALLGAATAAIPVAAQTAYPAKPVRIIVPFAPGGASDSLPRLLGSRLVDASQVRVIDTTDPTPMPPFVATGALSDAAVARLRSAFLAVHSEPSLAAARGALLLERFIVPDASVYEVQRSRAEEVERSGAVWP